MPASHRIHWPIYTKRYTWLIYTANRIWIFSLYTARWWFQGFFIFTSTSGNDPIRLDHNFQIGWWKPPKNCVFFRDKNGGNKSGSYCWWFRNAQQPPGMVLNPWQIMGFQRPTPQRVRRISAINRMILGHRGLPAKVASVAAAGAPWTTLSGKPSW